MPIEIYCKKNLSGVFVPDGIADKEVMEGLINNDVYRMTVVKPRNYKFHKKFFAMIDFAFEYWEPGEVKYNGQIVGKNKERFRHDVICQAGHCDLVISLNGEARVEAHSIAFGNMGEPEFNVLYKSVFDVCWKYVFNGMESFSKEDVERTVLGIMSFS